MGKLAIIGATFAVLVPVSVAQAETGPISRSEARQAVYRWWHGTPRRPAIQWQADIGSTRAIVTLRIPFASADGCVHAIDLYRVNVIRRRRRLYVSVLDQRLAGTIDTTCALGG